MEDEYPITKRLNKVQLRKLIDMAFDTKLVTIGRNPRSPRRWLARATRHLSIAGTHRKVEVLFQGKTLLECALSNPHTATILKAEARERGEAKKAREEAAA